MKQTNKQTNIDNHEIMMSIIYRKIIYVGKVKFEINNMISIPPNTNSNNSNNSNKNQTTKYSQP
jgi:hypothetical protein